MFFSFFPGNDLLRNGMWGIILLLLLLALTSFLGVVTSFMFLIPSVRPLVGNPSWSVRVPRRPRWPSSSSCSQHRRSLASFFHVGENVTVLPKSTGKGQDATEAVSILNGKISEVRGGGWYSVALVDDSSSAVSGRLLVVADEEVIKCRSTQLRSREDASSSTSSGNHIDNWNSTIDAEPVPPPTIINYDEMLVQAEEEVGSQKNVVVDDDLLQQLQLFQTYEKWVVFTDLHCAISTLETCLAVLDKVHREATDRHAGILFLGDWWHVRGSLRVDLLNAVLSQLSTWTQPMIMIPGNHDQTSWHTNDQHALRIFQNAYRIVRNDKTNSTSTVSTSGVLVLSYPTIFMNALFIPHVRDPSVLESILAAPTSPNIPTVFCHADVTGSSMNDNVVSQGGVSPLAFTGRTHVYTGHFHKPHVVQERIVYLGSPYETSLAEAEQDKAIVVLNRCENWRIDERLSMNALGKKHYKPTSVADFDRLIDILKAGDRVVYTQPRNQIQEERDAVESHAQQIRRLGAVVEVRPAITFPVSELMADRGRRRTELVAPSSLWRSFLDQQVDRGLIEKGQAEGLRTEGLTILDDVEKRSGATVAAVATPAAAGTTVATILQLDSVSIRGFGPFVEPQSYRLHDRGLVLLRGGNEDDGADR
jgi:Calcineurin-like phosphoesterase